MAKQEIDIREVVRAHVAKKYGTQRAAADAWGVTQPFVCAVLNGQRPVTAAMAADAGYELVQTSKWVKIKKA